jgi:predicted permease
MTRPSIRPSRLSQACLRWVTSRTRAEAVLGDIAEDAARRGGDGARSRVRVEVDVWRHVVAEAAWRLPSDARTARFVLRDAWRSLRSTPTASLFVLAVLTLGIAAATTTFSVVDAVVLRRLPFADANRLVVVEMHSEQSANSTLPVFVFEQLRSRAGSFPSLAAVKRGREQIATGGEPETVIAAQTTADLFTTLGVAPLLGRPFTAADEVAGREDVAVIGHSLWRRRFGGDPAVIGKPLQLVDRSVTVVAVMPPGFSYPMADDLRPEIWTPFVAPADERSGAQLSSYLQVVGRLAAGSTTAAADAEARQIFGALEPAGPSRLSGRRISVRPLTDALLGPVRGWMLILLAAVALLMLVACANVANLLLTRTARRGRELAVRASIGASRRHLVASALVESVLLSGAAVAIALLIASSSVDAARAALPSGIARASDIAVDLRVVVCAAIAGLVTGLAFGAVPAWHAGRQNLNGVLKAASRTASAGRPLWRSGLLVAQIAFLALLLVATTLFVGSFVGAVREDLGFVRENLVLASPPGLTVPVDEVLSRVGAAPGVTAVGGFQNGSAPLARAGGFGGGTSGTSVSRLDDASTSADVLFLRVAPGYLGTSGTPLLAGRDFATSELGRRDILILDEATARHLFGADDAVHRTIRLGRDEVADVIGVAANVKDRGPEAEADRMIYMPGTAAARGYLFLVRTAGDPGAVIPAMQAAFDGVRPAGGPPVVIRPMEEAFRAITADRRFAAGLMAIFAGIALAIGAIGLYGVIASIVEQQTREIGIRIALGADRRAVVVRIVSHASRHLIAGLAIGLPLSFVAMRGFDAIFFRVRSTNPEVYGIVALVIVAAGLSAAVLPARRAAGVDPLITLRAE